MVQWDFTFSSIMKTSEKVESESLRQGTEHDTGALLATVDKRIQDTGNMQVGSVCGDPISAKFLRGVMHALVESSMAGRQKFEAYGDRLVTRRNRMEKARRKRLRRCM